MRQRGLGKKGKGTDFHPHSKFQISSKNRGGFLCIFLLKKRFTFGAIRGILIVDTPLYIVYAPNANNKMWKNDKIEIV